MNQRPGYRDAEARRIIERAAQIDAEGRPLDALALREIAAEAGISASAVDRALAEHESTAVARAPWTRRYRAWLVVGAIAAALLVLMILRSPVAPQP